MPLSGTAADVHPPLYYLFVRLAYTVFGNQGWVYHTVSLIPCAIILLLSMTVFWKQFGKEFSVVLITLACLSGNAVHFNMEVRMYSWGSLFVLLSFYGLYCILQKGHRRSYLLFVASSLAAAYVHYYCLVAVAFYYLVLLYLAFFQRRLDRKRVSLACIGTVLGYLPWAFVLLRSIERVSGDYWITSIPTIKTCVRYLFSNQFRPLVWCGIAAGAAILVLYEMRMMEVERDGKGLFVLRLTGGNAKGSNFLIWVSAGLLSIAGTVLLGIAISKAMRPVFLTRYIYPVSVVAWTVLGVMVSRLKGRKLYTILILAYLLAVCLPAYGTLYSDEKGMDDKLSRTLDATVGEMGEDDVILTNISHISWTIADYYYPGRAKRGVDLSDFPELDAGVCYWLIVYDWEDMGKLSETLAEQGYTFETAVKDGNLGTHNVSIYRIEGVDAVAGAPG